jgi:drug/metabolite transporter (DMT)-like permease
VPPLAVILAAIFLGEAIRPVQVAGGVIILAGVALLRRGSWPRGLAIRESAGTGS